jgi:outer membrane protein
VLSLECSAGRHLARTQRLGAALLFMGLLSGSAVAQQPQPVETLTLEQAIALARQNNPGFLQQRNDEGVADWAVREAYGQLLPGASVSTGFSYQAAGTPRFGNFTASDLGISSSPAYLSSDFSAGISYTLSGASLFAPTRAKSDRRAAVARTEAADFQLVSDVTRQYLTVLRAADAVTLAKQELDRAQQNLKLANARVTVGAAIPLEAKQAEVDHGRTQVGLLQAENDLRTSKLRLVQQLGIELSGEVQLTSQFVVTPLAITQEELVRRAVAQHPNLRALRAAEDAADAGVKAARSQYLPSLDLSAGVSGYTRQASNGAFLVNQARQQALGAVTECELFNAVNAGLTTPVPGLTRDCSRLAFTPAREQEVLASNNMFPFNFTRQPWGLQMQLRLPLFNGLSRERQVETARIQRDDAALRLRAEELRLKADATAAYNAVETARQTVALEERNRSVADDQLRLARERYRVGAASFLELRDAETIKARADRSYLVALYSYHEGLAALEAAVGTQLRP